MDDSYFVDGERLFEATFPIWAIPSCFGFLYIITSPPSPGGLPKAPATWPFTGSRGCHKIPGAFEGGLSTPGCSQGAIGSQGFLADSKWAGRCLLLLFFVI